MNAIEICQQVNKLHTALLFRPKKDSTNDYEISCDMGIYTEVIEDMEDIAKREFIEKKGKGWVIIDAFTASAVVQIYDMLKPKQQAKFKTFRMKTIVDFTWKAVTK